MKIEIKETIMKIEIYVRNYNVIHVLKALNKFLDTNPHKDNKIVFKGCPRDNISLRVPISHRGYRQTIKFYIKDYLKGDFLYICSNLFKADISFRLSFHSLQGQTLIINDDEITKYLEEESGLIRDMLNSNRL